MGEDKNEVCDVGLQDKKFNVGMRDEALKERDNELIYAMWVQDVMQNMRVSNRVLVGRK